MISVSGLRATVLLLSITGLITAQQLSIPRIDMMLDKPSPYLMRDWKKVAIDYDNFVFDLSRTGNLLPLAGILTSEGVNYPAIKPMWMDTYVGQKHHGEVAEAINIIPAVVGASLSGVDKTRHFSINWVQKVKEFYNLKNGQQVYLNNYSSTTGHDWWYELMPNIYFYQLAELYPDADADFSTQLISIADRQLDVLFKLGASLQPWTVPSMNYRAFNLLTGKPLTTGVPEPESAGSIAWLLYQAYKVTGDNKYLTGAELALDFLQLWNTNPSYELQLPYGIVTAAQMNAVEGTNYNIDKMLNWVFSSGKGTLRNWGTIVGKWNGYDVSGLIGEANDGGNDYAFIMNGFQHAAALAPVVKYDKRYANAIGKWILNLANASRLFYANALPEANQHPASYAWSKQYDPESAIPFEAMKQNMNGKSPFVTGDAVRGGWATTDLSLYSGSSVGYLASIINRTNVEGILQIDLNKTDFRGENTYPVFLYYNPENSAQNVNFPLPEGSFDLYDALSESILSTNVSGTISFNIQPNSSRLLVLIPPGKSKQTTGRIRRIYNGAIFDFHYRYNYTNPLRIKAFTSDLTRVASPGKVNFHCIIENNPEPARFKWFANEVELTGITGEMLQWEAPAASGLYTIRCEVTSAYTTLRSSEIDILVAPAGEVLPEIMKFTLSGKSPYPAGGSLNVEAAIAPSSATFEWKVSGGNIINSQTLTPEWKLPELPGFYTLQLKVSNILGSDSLTQQLLVKDLRTENYEGSTLVYYPLNGNTLNAANNLFHAVAHNIILSADQRGITNNAYTFPGNGYLVTANDPGLNFTDKLTVSLWIQPEKLPGYEQYILSHGSYEDRYKLSITPDNKVRWTVRTSNGIVDVDDNLQLQSGEFVHYTATYTGYSLELYRNGQLANYKPLSGSLGTTAKNLTLARKEETEPNYTFNGVIDEVRIYNAELPVNYILRLPAFWDLASGVNNYPKAEQPVMFPNPVSTDAVIRYPGIKSLHLINAQGQTFPLTYDEVEGGVAIRVTNLAAGIYMLVMGISDGNTGNIRFIKH